MAGVVLLVLPAVNVSGSTGSVTRLALLLAPQLYAAGVVLLRRVRIQASPFVIAGWQMLGGALSLWVGVCLSNDGFPHPTFSAWAAWGYLVAIGSIVGFTSFVAALRRLPAPLFMSHAWINPLVATTLGVIWLNERVTHSAVAASILIILGVYTLARSSSSPARRPTEDTGKLPSRAVSPIGSLPGVKAVFRSESHVDIQA